MIEAGIVGLGWWGKILVNSVQGKSGKIRFTKGTVRNPSKVQDFATEKGFELVPSYQDLLQDNAIDAVAIVIPHTLHEEYVTAAARAGKAIFVEKPFTLSKASAERTIAEVKQAMNL